MISIQNKILFRAAFFFKTYVIVFSEPVKANFLSFQKKEFIRVGEKEVVKEVE